MYQILQMYFLMQVYRFYYVFRLQLCMPYRYTSIYTIVCKWVVKIQNTTKLINLSTLNRPCQTSHEARCSSERTHEPGQWSVLVQC